MKNGEKIISVIDISTNSNKKNETLVFKILWNFFFIITKTLNKKNESQKRQYDILALNN